MANCEREDLRLACVELALESVVSIVVEVAGRRLPDAPAGG